MSQQNIPAHRYTAALAQELEEKWQKTWAADGTYRAPNPAGPWADQDAPRVDAEKVLILDMFPYPSGAGLHVGHPLGYIATDVTARYHRMNGKNVLHCMGYDAFGLPAEQYAIETGQHPRITTEANREIMAAQLKRLGLGHDDRRAISTIDPSYYRWTQWIFREIFEAWYDEDAVRADGGKGKARPIAELRAEFAAGTRALPGEFEGRAWADLTSVEQAGVVDSYRLAFADEAPVNWAPGLGTVLSNEEVTNDGRSERGNFPVFRKALRQWKMRITAYADRLADDLDRVDWPDKVKAMQRNWIGRSNGARVTFSGPAGEPIEVFTTRPDTLFGATFMVLAPEHPLVESMVPDAWPADIPAAWTGGVASPNEAVEAYRREASRKSDVERQRDDKAKTGVFTGAYATNPVSGAQVPVFIADYVLMGYGTGAIMAVPAHDDRDFEFAQAFDVPIVDVIAPKNTDDWDGTVDSGAAFTGEGVAVNSSNDEVSLDGMGVKEAKARITQWLVDKRLGESTVNYRLRDWLFSRQRYWGEPFPIVFDDDGVAHSIPESMLPLELPDVPDFSPKTFEPEDDSSAPEPTLARATDWVSVELDLGDGKGTRRFTRETNTMPNWAGSCWYYLRYLDPANDEAFVDPAVEQYWMGRHDNAVEGAPAGVADPGGVDLYIGGVEHAVLHLLYARFWHKVLFDLGHVSSEEPFRKYFSQGYIQAPAYRDDRGQPVPAAEVEESDGVFTWQGQVVQREFGKIGKSLKNVVSPDDICDEYGTDTLRLYEMAMGPLEQSKPWETRAIVGSNRYLARLWRNVIDETTGEVTVVDDAPDDATAKLLHKTIDAVRTEYEALRFNTAIAKMTELNNALTKLKAVPREAAEALVLMTSPLAPHIAEELWQRLGHDDTVVYAPFPVADPALLVEDSVTCVVQVMGKLRDTIDVPVSITAEELEALALARPKVQSHIEGKTMRKIINKPPKLINFVAT